MPTPTLVTDRATFRSVAADAPPGGRVPVELRTEVRDPFMCYRRARDGPGGVFLETTGGQSGWGYFATEPVDRLTVSAEAVLADREPDRAGDYRRSSPSLAALDGLLADERLHRGPCSVPYPCGTFGWLAYDIAHELETLPGEAADDRGLPRLQVGVFDRVAAWREPHDEPVTLHVTCCPKLPAEALADETALDAIYDRAVDRARSLATAAVEGDPEVGEPPVEATEATFESECGRAAFADRVRQIQAYIRDGDTFQTNLSQCLTAPAAVHPVEAYDALRRVNPAPYAGLVEFSGRGDDRWAGVDLVSASPELLLEREGDRLVTEPIAGTRPRGRTPEADDAFEAELRSDDKERAEHAMLVDLERNDLGKVSEFGSVGVSEYRRVDRYSEVMHLVSVVEGRLRADRSLADAIAAVFPGGTITGAPKPRTMEIIDELEPTQRGPYTGSIGVFGFDGRATLNIVIRTLTRHDDRYRLRVGAGIVDDSDPDAEFDETMAKGRALITAIDEALEAGRLTIEEAAE
ncbi:anthranilate synthase component I family protein [Halohasta salina]|uniref:anthranilate synthase component I family protein n=1 Tax=Halohasta salina TaxID=2961621 RepID=UPI0020A5F4AA|nr:anthranilate synthase component I family protein [Halohasta salina]